MIRQCNADLSDVTNNQQEFQQVGSIKSSLELNMINIDFEDFIQKK